MEVARPGTRMGEGKREWEGRSERASWGRQQLIKDKEVEQELTGYGGGKAVAGRGSSVGRLPV